MQDVDKMHKFIGKESRCLFQFDPLQRAAPSALKILAAGRSERQVASTFTFPSLGESY